MRLSDINHVNGDSPRLTWQHTFADGHKLTIKLFTGLITRSWEIKPTEAEMIRLYPEYWQWWETVLQEIFKSFFRKPLLSCRLALNEYNSPERVVISRTDGITFEIIVPSDGCYIVEAFRNGSGIAVSKRLAGVLGQFVETFVFNNSTR